MAELAHITRRKILKGFAASSVVAVPAIATAATPDELPIEAFERLSTEMSDVLNHYLDGRFYARIYPSDYHECNIILMSIAAEQRKASLDEQLTNCVKQLRGILAEMHPAATVSAQRCDEVDTQNVAYMFNVRYPELSWTGPGLYRLIYDEKGRVETFWVDRHWAADDRKYMYAAAWRFDGHNVGPREIYSDQTLRIVEKLPDPLTS